MKFAGAFSVALAVVLLLGTGQAATRRFATDLPFLDLYPSNTTPGHANDTGVDLSMPGGRPMAKVVYYIPAGYGNVLGRPPGTDVGEFGIRNDVDRSQTQDGSLTADDPAHYPHDPCAPGLHQAVWLMHLWDPYDLNPTPLFLDATTGADTALGGYKAQVCLPAASGIFELDLGLTKLVNPAASGAYKWRVFVTPYKASVPDATGTLEVRATVPMPMKLTLHGRYDRKHKRALLTGQLTATGYPLKGVYLDLYTSCPDCCKTDPCRDYVHSGAAPVNQRGFFSIKQRIKRTTRFKVATGNSTDCDPGSPAPAGCFTDTLANIASPVALVKVPVRKH
jgi:hypothetical protein